MPAKSETTHSRPSCSIGCFSPSRPEAGRRQTIRKESSLSGESVSIGLRAGAKVTQKSSPHGFVGAKATSSRDPRDREALLQQASRGQIGRASCRERVCQYV